MRGAGFWQSLEQYSWKLVGRSPLPRYWMWIVIGLIGVVMVTSWLSHPNSVVGARDMREVISLAAERGDYETARGLLNHYTIRPLNQSVLGAESELEDRVYPERIVTRRIAELEEKLETYPENKEIYLILASLYDQLGNTEKSGECREKARILDPNGTEFQ